MIGKILAEGNAKLRELGLGSTLDKAAETGSVVSINRAYIDSLTIEGRMIDTVCADTRMELFGEMFETPIMTAALSGMKSICNAPMVQIAKGALDAGACNWAGIGSDEELQTIIDTGAKTIKIIKPYRDMDLIFHKIKIAEQMGALAVGMDITFFFGGKHEDSLIRANLMGPKTLDDIKRFVHATRLPFILKGVLSEQDARKALEAGAGAIVVSHHGGAFIDYAVPPLKILPNIAKVIGKRIPIFIDSGIVRGTDVFKALALGADGVLVGRSVMAGLAYGGADGVQALLSGTNEELRRVMSLTCCPTIKDIDPGLIWQ